MINVYCRDHGWLFEDLKRDIAAVADDVVTSEEPLLGADAWIAIRTNEAEKCPAYRRLVCQCHDFRKHTYPPGLAHISYVHPKQRADGANDEDNYEATQDTKVSVLPIGARRLFTLRESMPERFTVGWVGRDVIHDGRHIKRPQLFVDAVRAARRQGCEVGAAFYGPPAGTPGNLSAYYQQALCAGGKHVEIPGAGGASKFEGDASGATWYHAGDRAESLRDFYHSIDALVVTCDPEPGPLSVYEALACGVPIVLPADQNSLDYQVDAPPGTSGWVFQNTRFSQWQSLARAILSAREERHRLFRQRADLRRWVTHWQDDWCKAQVDLARGLV